MRFQIILNMPSHRGGPVHSIFVEHEAKSLEDLMNRMERDGYLVATELYKVDDGDMAPHHEIGITASTVGKVKYVD
jgi:hypothetical protein